MNNLIKLIPYDIIINIIEPFTRSTQNTNILKDIVSFTTTINLIYDKYYKMLCNIINPVIDNTITTFEQNVLKKIAWYFLEIDLHCFIIENELQDGFLQLMNLRHFLRLRHITDLEFIIKSSEYKKTKSVVYKLWGILSSNQRTKFLIWADY